MGLRLEAALTQEAAGKTVALQLEAAVRGLLLPGLLLLGSVVVAAVGVGLLSSWMAVRDR